MCGHHSLCPYRFAHVRSVLLASLVLKHVHNTQANTLPILSKTSTCVIHTDPATLASTIMCLFKEILLQSNSTTHGASTISSSLPPPTPPPTPFPSNNVHLFKHKITTGTAASGKPTETSFEFSLSLSCTEEPSGRTKIVISTVPRQVSALSLGLELDNEDQVVKATVAGTIVITPSPHGTATVTANFESEVVHDARDKARDETRGGTRGGTREDEKKKSGDEDSGEAKRSELCG